MCWHKKGRWWASGNGRGVEAQKGKLDGEKCEGVIGKEGGVC